MQTQIIVTQQALVESSQKLQEMEGKFEQQKQIYGNAKAILDKKKSALKEWENELIAVETKLSKAGEGNFFFLLKIKNKQRNNKHFVYFLFSRPRK